MSKFTITVSGETLAETLSALMSSAMELDRRLARDAGGAAPSFPTNSGGTNYSPTTTIAQANVQDDDDGAPADVNAPAFDKTGIPWDERIHSSSKKQGNDGTWNRRRNTPDALWNSVMAELRARVAGGSGAAGAPPPTMAAPPVMQAPASAPPFNPPYTQAGAPVAGAPMTAPPVMQQQAAPSPAPAAPEGMTFQKFMPLLSAAMHAGRFTPEELASWQAMPEWQIAEIGHLMNDPDKVQRFYNWLKHYGKVD